MSPRSSLCTGHTEIFISLSYLTGIISTHRSLRRPSSKSHSLLKPHEDRKPHRDLSSHKPHKYLLPQSTPRYFPETTPKFLILPSHGHRSQDNPASWPARGGPRANYGQLPPIPGKTAPVTSNGNGPVAVTARLLPEWLPSRRVGYQRHFRFEGELTLRMRASRRVC